MYVLDLLHLSFEQQIAHLLQLTVIVPLSNLTVQVCRAGGVYCNVNSGNMTACPWQIVPRYDVELYIDTTLGAIDHLLNGVLM